jgi:integrase
LGPLWCLLLTTGLRRGEALGLRWIDVDLGDARLEVRQTVVAVKGTPLISEPKTKTGRRTVYLSGRTIEALGQQRVRQKADQKLVGSAWENSGLVFTTTTGGLLHPRNVLRDFQIALDRANLPKVRLHDLRHTVATLLLHEGAHPKVVQELLGHANVAITLNTYSHATPGLHSEAADMLEGVLKL